jgi:hypothetical protein
LTIIMYRIVRLPWAPRAGCRPVDRAGSRDLPARRNGRREIDMAHEEIVRAAGDEFPARGGSGLHGPDAAARYQEV